MGEELRSLAAAEQVCCSFVFWTVTEDDVRITAPRHGVTFKMVTAVVVAATGADGSPVVQFDGSTLSLVVPLIATIRDRDRDGDRPRLAQPLRGQRDQHPPEPTESVTVDHHHTPVPTPASLPVEKVAGPKLCWTPDGTALDAG